MTVDEQPISPDGVTMEHGKVFNRTYPGPWIGKRNIQIISRRRLTLLAEACWGDWLGRED